LRDQGERIKLNAGAGLDSEDSADGHFSWVFSARRMASLEFRGWENRDFCTAGFQAAHASDFSKIRKLSKTQEKSANFSILTLAA